MVGPMFPSWASLLPISLGKEWITIHVRHYELWEDVYHDRISGQQWHPTSQSGCDIQQRQRAVIETFRF